MISAIVPAAGQSLRMGTQKLLLPLGKTTVIAHVVDALLAGGLSQIIVVRRPGDSRISEALTGRDVQFAGNPDPKGDMLSSVRCGLRVLPGDCQALMLALGDQPAITPELVRALLAAYARQPEGILVPVFQGRRGHPMIFSAKYRTEILEHHDASGLRGLLLAHPQELCEWTADSSAVLEDMDLPEDYQRELARQAGEE
jgi:molybdenum cofactor cytidylyltransferase